MKTTTKKALTRSTLAVLATTTALSLSACSGSGDSAQATSASKKTSVSAPSKTTQPSFMKNGRINPLAVTPDNVDAACTAMLGNPTTIYKDTPSFVTDSLQPQKVTDNLAAENVTGWTATSERNTDSFGNYTAFSCEPKMGLDAKGAKPDVYVVQYTSGPYASRIPSKAIPNPTFGISPNYDKIVDGKVFVSSHLSTSMDYASDQGLARMAQAVTSGKGIEAPNANDDGVVTLSPSQITARVKQASAERVSTIKPFIDTAAGKLTAG